MSMWYAPPTPPPPFVSVILKLTVWPWSTLMFVAKPCNVGSPTPPALQVADGVPGFEFSQVMTFQPGLLHGSVSVAELDENPNVRAMPAARASSAAPRALRHSCARVVIAGATNDWW